MSQLLTFNLDVDNKQAIDSINTFFDAFDAGVKNVGQKMDQQFKNQNVNIEMRLEGGKLVAKEINNAASAGNKLEKAMNVVSGKFGQTAKEVNNSVSLLRTLVASTNKYKENTKELNDDWVKLVKLLREAKAEAKDFEVSDQPERSITGANIAAGLALDAIRALGNGFRNLVNEGIQMEVLMIQLKGFTGSTEAAQAAFDQFLKIAAATPFNVTQVAEGARTMMGFGLTTAEATHRIEQLAIVASATGGELTHMARNLGQIQANQRAYTRDLMQFANQGIPIYQMLGQVMGENTQTIRELAEEGHIGFNEVAAALDLMTEKGSAFRVIAEEMDRTFAARLEALQGTISATAGKFIEMFQALDTALGGPVSNTFAFVITVVEKIGKAFDFVKKNAKTFAPIVAAVAAAFATLIGLAIAQNLAAIGTAFVLLKAKIMATTIATNALAVAQAIVAALSGNYAALALAAGVGAAAAIYFGRSTSDAADEAKRLNEELSHEKFSASAKSAELLAFNTENLDDATKKYIETEKELFDEMQKHYELRIANAERAFQWLQKDSAERKKVHEDAIDHIKNEIKAEKEGLKQTMEAAKEAHNTKLEGLKEELRVVRERYDEELRELDQQSVYAKKLEKIRRKEILDKLKKKDLTEKETLELKEQLHQMKTRIKRRAVLAEKAKEEAKIQDQIRKTQDEHKKNMKDIKAQYENRIKILEDAKNKEKRSIDEIEAELKSQADLIKKFKDEELRSIYRNRDEAIKAIQAQLREAEQLKRVMEAAYATAKRVNQEATRSRSVGGGSAPGSGTRSARASGGPVSGGSTYTVNELGKEAFLSAAGKLSMINAPAWGSWKAPSSGTVIPAHLTKQLSIPSGGINVNRTAAANASKAGRNNNLGGLMRALQSHRGGNSYNNQVTIQSSNPNQTASDMLVSLNRIRSRRYS